MKEDRYLSHFTVTLTTSQKVCIAQLNEGDKGLKSEIQIQTPKQGFNFHIYNINVHAYICVCMLNDMP